MADSRANHARHDLELVAAYAAGEATGADLDRAERLLDACDLCVEMARDLRAITFALQELPAIDAMAELPRAPRDFRLAAEQATALGRGAHLRPAAGGPQASLGGWMNQLLGAITAFGRPVGASLATLGLIGVLVGTANLGPLGGGAATSAPVAPIGADMQATAAPAPGDAGGAAGAQPAATNGADGRTEFGASATTTRRARTATARERAPRPRPACRRTPPRARRKRPIPDQVRGSSCSPWRPSWVASA